MAQKLVTITNRVNNSAIRRIKNERGDLVYVVPSYTLPDNVVMNGGLYPADEIERGYETLEDAPAPAGHPYNVDGEYISANSSDGILYFQCGIFNKNVQRVADDKYGHRVYVEKHIHVETAMKSERGKAIINAIDRGEAIHTSTGVMLEPVPTDQPMVNEAGKEYTWVATNMTFDHDAVLLGEEGAATPDDGVGMLVNHKLLTEVKRDGMTMAVNSVSPNIDQPEPITVTDQVMAALKQFFNRGNSHTTNREDEDMAYKERVESALKKAEINFEDMSDEEKMNAYDKLMKGNAAQDKEEAEQRPSESQANSLTAEQVAEIAANAATEALKANREAEESAERDALAKELAANSEAFTEDELKAMPVAVLNKIKAQSTPAYGFGGGVPAFNTNAQSRFADELPE